MGWIARVTGVAIAGLASFAAGAATVVAVSPEGEVGPVRQVTVKFSGPVVTFGDPRAADPYAVACQGAAAQGSGRWASDRVWLYDFKEPLGPGSRCTATLRPEWKPIGATAPGAASSALSTASSVSAASAASSASADFIAAPRFARFTFSTGGPAVVTMQPADGSEIEEDQHFLLRLNGPAVEATVLANAWCEVEGLGDRIPLRLVGGDVRAQVLKARRVTDKVAMERTLVARCDRPLANTAAMRVIWGRGIASAANPQVVTTVQQRFRYTVRPAFTAEFTCERERASAPCLPIRPMSVHFSAPVPREQAVLVRLKPAAGGNALAPVLDKDDKSAELSDIAFAVPLAENARYAVELPPGLKDNAGRTLANAASFPLQVATGGAPPIAKFAAAPFGIVERFAEKDGAAMLPVTLRHVQPDLRTPAASATAASGGVPNVANAPSGGQVRVKRLQTDADILAWYARVQKYHETQLTAEELGLPKNQWTVLEEQQDENGKTVKRRVERRIATRELSLLDKDAGAARLALPQLVGGDPRPFEVIGLPLAGPGYHVVEIESLRLGQSLLDKRAPMFVRTGVLVTNLGVHFKWGRENSLVWVTTLDRGKPVAGADVVVADCRGQPLWNGRTDAQGLAVAQRALDTSNAACPADSGFFVTARQADDVAFVFSSWQKGIEPWRFNVPAGRGTEPDLRATTVFDRTLLRAGETVSMKHFARLETSRGLSPVPADRLPTRLKIVHQGSGQEQVFPLRWNGAGRNALTAWNIPPAAKLGVYDVVLEREPPAVAANGTTAQPLGDEENARQRSWTSGSFRVEEFRLPLVKADVSGPKGVLVAPASVPVNVQMSYFSGGAMAAAPLRASALLKARSPSFTGYDEFTFEPPRDPRETARDAEPDSGEDSEPGDGAEGGKLVVDKLALVTDRAGAASFTVPRLPPIVRPSQIDAEVSFADPNGETQTVAARIDLWPSAVVLGIKAGAWASNRGKASFSVLALDTAGKPIAGQEVAVVGRVSQVITTRKRIVGGFYAYDNRTDVKELGNLCTGRTDARGLLACEATLDAAGQVELIATAKDAQAHPAQAATSVWITTQGELWFAQDNDDRIDVLAEKKRYEPGETARLQVRMPFREATALVAVEREGVLATQVVTLRGDDPTVQLKIDAAWGPNVFVSVLALRGRVRETPWYSLFTWGWREPASWWRSFRGGDGQDVQAPTAMVDLAKPSFKFGVAALRVGTAAHELQVSVSADKPQYLVRQKAIARVKVMHDGKPAAGAEFAFAAVDEGLLALRGNGSWQLLEAMLQDRAWGVETSTAQSEIIGRRHYGRKAVAAGGGGGRGATRELFDTLLVWKPSVTLDAAGEATIEVPLNDSLTSFRLVAIADAADAADATQGEVQRFGTGSTSIRVTQDLQVLAGLPPLVRDGDRFQAMLTLRNTTAREMKVRAALQGTAALPGKDAADIVRVAIALPAQDVVLAAGAAREIVWPIEVPAEALSIAWDATAEESGGAKDAARDGMKVTQLVAAAVPVRVLQATLVQLDGPFTLPVQAPADALSTAAAASGAAAGGGVKRGGLNVAVQPKLSGALPGMRRFFETYPFVCLEQKTSRSVGLRDAALWNSVASALPSYLDSDGLASYFPPRAEDGTRGSDRLTAYVLAATHEAGFALPPAAQESMLAGLTAFVEGRIERKFWSPAFANRIDLDVRKLAALEALSRYGRAQAKMLGSINVAPTTWPTAAVIDWLNILKRVDGVPERARRLEEANQILRARLTYAGTTLRFSTEDSDFWWWLMDSADANAARLILAVLDDPAWKDDLPKMVVGSLARQQRGAWLTTTANLWGSLALDKFSAKFEAVAPAGRTVASVGTAASSVVADWSVQPRGAALKLAWPAGAASLDVAQQGAGRPWLTVQSLAAVSLKAPLRAGYGVTRSLVAVEQKDKAGWSRGDIVRVRLEIEAQSDMTWVVVSDPVPGGATILGSGLGRDSQIATRTEKRSGSASPAFEERGFEAFRSYFEFMPRGRHVVEYTVRLNNPGRFAMPPTRVEAMYAPESFGEAPNAVVVVAR